MIERNGRAWRAKQPTLRCPVCGYEYTPESHGWAFMTSKNTKCEGPESKNSYGHPFEVVE